MESAENQAQSAPNNESKLAKKSSLSKTETIALLNESIDRLEETISKISQDSAKVPSSKSLDTLLATTQELEAAVTNTETKVAPAKAIVNPPTPQPTVSPPIDSQTTTTNPVSQSPDKSKPNVALISLVVAAVAIAIVAVFWLWKPQQLANFFPPAESQPTPTGIVVAPPQDPVSPSLTTTPQAAFEPTPVSGDNLGIVSDISAMDFPPEIESVAEPVEDVVETVIPEELTAPGRAKNLKMVAIKPQLNFTPEQNLVAVLNNKVSELIDSYPQDLVQTVSVDLPASSLLVKVTDNWYDLDAAERDSLGNEILARARAFQFQNLELRDDSGTLVARNPIIGENIIILPNEK